MTLLYIAFGWIVGLYIAAAAPVTQSLWVSVVVIGAAVAIFFRRETTLRLAGLVVLVGGLALWRSTAAQMAITPSHVAHYNDAGYADVIGMVSAAPDVSDNAIRLRVSVERYRRYEVQELVTGDVLVYADRQGDFRYGDWVRISGSLDTPTVFDTFSWRDYLARQGIYTVIFRAKVEVLDRDRGNPITAALLSIRDQAREVIYKVLPSPSSDFMAGILLGDDSGFAPEVSESFRKTGTSHLLAISGANMVVVIGLLHAIFSRLIKNPRAVVVVSITGIVLYTIFVGASASVVRAAIMSSLGLIAQRVGRRSDALTSLAATFMLLTIINPNSAFDLGLIFSTAATLGLLLYLPPLQKWTEALLHRLFHAETAQKIASVLADVILIGLAAQIIVLPLMIFFFQEFSLVSFPVNILVAPVQAPIMILGIVMMFLGMIWLPLGQIVAWLVQLPLIYMLSVIRSAAATSGTLIFNLSPSILVGYYAFALGIPYVASMPPGQRQVWWKTLRSTFSFSLLTIVGLGVATLLWIVVLSRPDGKLHVNFLDVGEGIAVLIQTPNGAHILIDGGENPTRLQTALGDHLPTFKNYLDALILTDMRRATIAAIPPLLDRYEVGSVFFNALEADGQIEPAVSDAIKRQQKEGIALEHGSIFTTDDGVAIEVLTPPVVVASPNPQDSALLLRLKYGDASFLITSEMSEEAIKQLLHTESYFGSTVLLLPSNGAERKSLAAFTAMVVPQVAVIAADAGDRAASPDDSVLALLKNLPLFRTDRQGSIEMVTDGKTLWIYSSK